MISTSSPPTFGLAEKTTPSVRFLASFGEAQPSTRDGWHPIRPSIGLCIRPSPRYEGSIADHRLARVQAKLRFPSDPCRIGRARMGTAIAHGRHNDSTSSPPTFGLAEKTTPSVRFLASFSGTQPSTRHGWHPIRPSIGLCIRPSSRLPVRGDAMKLAVLVALAEVDAASALARLARESAARASRGVSRNSGRTPVSTTSRRERPRRRASVDRELTKRRAEYSAA